MNSSTIVITPAITGTPRRRKDPILQELWAVKAQMNQDAGYDVRRLYAQVQQAAAVLFDSNGRVRCPDN